MLRRSERAKCSGTGKAVLPNPQGKLPHKSIPAQSKLRAEYADASDTARSLAINKDFQAKHTYKARTEQTIAVMDLLNAKTTILLAGTGFGKSRVPEMFYHAHEDKYAPIILSINPLESLGHDQVSEKAAVGISAVNLTGANCTPQTCEDILQGKYNFVYVSPEIALTSDGFDTMWRTSSFQARLVLIVVDEAHMVYEWGLVASGKAKRLASHTRVQDAGVFRPSYGDLSRRILSAGKIPLLLMTATCTPQALLAITDNLKLDTRDVRIIRAELTRPELRLLRRAFKRPLKSSLRGIWAHHTFVPTDSIPPTLIYCGTQNATLEFLLIICMARGVPNEAANGRSTFARRYHATTGPRAKLDAVDTYVSGALAVLCCTLALGLGQNWHRVRRVVIVGRQSPSNFIQMSGRCGRDGRRGLGILLVESNRTKGKNKIADFIMPTRMTDDDRMDALAITPVCLRVALAVDLRCVPHYIYNTDATGTDKLPECSHGYIPLHSGCIEVMEEAERQKTKGMSDCDCSNCKPEEAEALWLAQAALTNDNFDQALKMGTDELHGLISDLPEPPPPLPAPPRLVALLCRPDDKIYNDTVLEALVTRWEGAFGQFFLEKYPRRSALGPRDYFGRDLAWDLAKNIDVLQQPNDLEIVLVSKTIPGQFLCLFDAFLQWQDDFDTGPAFTDAALRREATSRPNTHLPIPQSIKGFLMAQERTLAEKKAIKAARDLAKEEAALFTAAKKDQTAREKLAAAERKKLAKAATCATRKQKVTTTLSSRKDPEVLKAVDAENQCGSEHQVHLESNNGLKRTVDDSLDKVSLKRVQLSHVNTFHRKT